MAKPRYVHYEYPPNAQFQHAVLDTRTGRPAATLPDKATCELVAKYMSEAEDRARKDFAPYIDAVEGLAKVMIHTLGSGMAAPATVASPAPVAVPTPGVI